MHLDSNGEIILTNLAYEYIFIPIKMFVRIMGLVRGPSTLANYGLATKHVRKAYSSTIRSLSSFDSELTRYIFKILIDRF